MLTRARRRSSVASTCCRPRRRPRPPSSSCFLLASRRLWVGWTRAWGRKRSGFVRAMQVSWRSRVLRSPGDRVNIRLPLLLFSAYPQEAGRAATEYPVHITNGGLSPCCGASCSSRGGSRCALDVVVEALDDVAGARLFEVLCLDSQDVIFELQLHGGLV
jgi:hypothetical protein